MSDATRLVRQTFERLVKAHPRAYDAQLLKLLKRAARGSRMYHLRPALRNL